MKKLDVIKNFYFQLDKFNSKNQGKNLIEVKAKFKTFFLKHFTDFYRYDVQKAFEVLDVFNGISSPKQNKGNLYSPLNEQEYSLLMPKQINRYIIRLQKRYKQKNKQLSFSLNPKSGKIEKKHNKEFKLYKKNIKIQMLKAKSALIAVKRKKIRSIVKMAKSQNPKISYAS